jgi:signal transduction histidine kinase
MTVSRPAFLVGAPGPDRDQVQSRLGDPSLRIFDSVGEFLRASDLGPGRAYLLAPGLDPASILEAISALAVGRGEWTPVLVRREEGEWVARTLSLGYPHALAALVDEASAREESVLLELRSTLAEISRARHDINNPLTSALAEVQLLQMDDLGGEAASSLQVVLDQLRRIRDLVADTRRLRLLE